MPNTTQRYESSVSRTTSDQWRIFPRKKWKTALWNSKSTCLWMSFICTTSAFPGSWFDEQSAGIFTGIRKMFQRSFHPAPLAFRSWRSNRSNSGFSKNAKSRSDDRANSNGGRNRRAFLESNCLYDENRNATTNRPIFWRAWIFLWFYSGRRSFRKSGNDSSI